jgi:hypothetical protein
MNTLAEETPSVDRFQPQITHHILSDQIVCGRSEKSLTELLSTIEVSSVPGCERCPCIIECLYNSTIFRSLRSIQILALWGLTFTLVFLTFIRLSVGTVHLYEKILVAGVGSSIGMYLLVPPALLLSSVQFSKLFRY